MLAIAELRQPIVVYSWFINFLGFQDIKSDSFKAELHLRNLGCELPSRNLGKLRDTRPKPDLDCLLHLSRMTGNLQSSQTNSLFILFSLIYKKREHSAGWLLFLFWLVIISISLSIHFQTESVDGVFFCNRSFSKGH